jgi:hypothetical protein
MFGLALNTSHFKKERFSDFMAAGKIFLLLFFIPAALTIFIEMRTGGILYSYTKRKTPESIFWVFHQ